MSEKEIPDYIKNRQFHDKNLAVRKSFGKKLRVLRKSQNYSQESFAFKCDLHRTYIGDIERGLRNVSLDNLARIAEALELNMDSLFEGVEY